MLWAHLLQKIKILAQRKLCFKNNEGTVGCHFVNMLQAVERVEQIYTVLLGS